MIVDKRNVKDGVQQRGKKAWLEEDNVVWK